MYRNKNVGITTLLCISFMVMLTFSSQGNAAPLPDQSQGDEKMIRISWPRDMGDLNPHLYSPNQMFAQAMVYEPLVRYGIDGSIHPHLAKRWDISEDGRKFTFYLREDVEFSDGSPFNAEAVKMNFDAVLNNKARHSWMEIVRQIDGTEIIDEYVFTIVFQEPYYPALQELSLIRPFRFLSPAGFPDDGDTSEMIKKPLGTGPWVLSEQMSNEYAVFERNNRYWGEKPLVDKVWVHIIPDGETRAMAFEKGEVDMIFGSGLISRTAFIRLRETGNYETAISEPLATRFMVINTNRFPTNDLNVRLAIQHALNKEEIIGHVFQGLELRADTLFAENFPYCNLGLKPYEYDPAKTEELLYESGWLMDESSGMRQKNGEILNTDLCFDINNEIHKTLAEIIQSELRKLGMQVNLVGEERQSYLDREKYGSFHLIFNNTWGAPYDPHTFVSSMRVPAHADYQAQQGLAMKADLDRTIEEVLLSTDEETRQELYRDILSTLHEQAVYLPISYETNIAIHHKNVSGVKFATKYEIPLSRVIID